MLLIGFGSCRQEPDYSFTSKQYREMGMPDWNDAWTMDEYGDVMGTLRNVQIDDPLSLPRKGSRNSGDLFNHLVSMENLQFLYDESLPLYDKARRVQPYLHVHEEFCDIYTNLHSEDQYYHRELVDLYIFGLSIVNAMIDLAHQINESDDKRDISMRQGYPTMQYTYRAMVTGILNEQRYISRYFKKDLEVLGDSIASSVEKNKFWFDQPTAGIIKEKMGVVVDSTSSAHIKETYSSIMNTL
jgi:hypothetical protein